MTFQQSISTCWHKYVTFQGRASRSEYWWWVLFQFIIGIVLGLISFLVGFSGGSNWPVWLGYAVSLVFFLPSLAVSIRRLHDIGNSGWWYLICFIPLVGPIWLIVKFATPSQPQPNQYGVPPTA